MSGACLTGSIPSSLGSVVNLKHFSVQNDVMCKFGGEKPIVVTFPQSMGSLSELETLSVKIWGAGTIPPSFSNMTLLRDIFISEGISGPIPSGWNTLAHLKALRLKGTSLSGFPDDTTYDWPQLEVLEVVMCTSFRMNAVSVFEGAPNLRHLRLAFCSSVYGKLEEGGDSKWPKHLRTIELSEPSLSGSISSLFWDRMEDLEIFKIGFAWRPSLRIEFGSNIGKMRNLTYLDFQNIEELTGTMPEDIGKLSKLTHIGILNSPLLHGTIPTSISELSSLQSISITRTAISGSLPERIGDLRKLSYLFPSANALSGPVPQSIGSLRNLFLLDLSDNVLSGTLPDSIGDLTLLLEINLSGNRLEGSLPNSLENLLKLETFTASKNMLSGTIPDIKAARVELQHNRLVGGIPRTLAKSAISLVLNHNLLGGNGYVLPENIFEGNKATALLDLSFNNFINSPLPQLFNPERNVHVNLDSNGFIGPIPPSYCVLSARLHLSGNLLSGGLDDILSPDCQLSYLDASDNAFTGTISPTLRNLSLLESLDLSDNYLFGSLPPVGALLESLVVSNNFFSGKLSKEFLESVSPPLETPARWLLKTLDLAGNRLECPDAAEDLAALLVSQNLEYISLARNQFECVIGQTMGRREKAFVDWIGFISQQLLRTATRTHHWSRISHCQQ